MAQIGDQIIDCERTRRISLSVSRFQQNLKHASRKLNEQRIECCDDRSVVCKRDNDRFKVQTLNSKLRGY